MDKLLELAAGTDPVYILLMGVYIALSPVGLFVLRAVAKRTKTKEDDELLEHLAAVGVGKAALDAAKARRADRKSKGLKE